MNGRMCYYTVLSTPTGNRGMLPTVLCGDFNCKPNSPMLDFITSSFLNYSKMSAAEIAGYTSRRGQSRLIPYPLLPPSMNIGPNCMFVENETAPADTVVPNGVDAKRGSSESKSTQQSSDKMSCQEEGTSSSSRGANDFVDSQNENFKDDGPSHQKRYSRARSARGAKARGMSYSGVKISDFQSLLGSKSATEVSSAQNGQNTTSSTAAAVEDDDDSDMEWEREKYQEDSSLSSSSASAESSRTEARASTVGGSARCLSHSEPKRRALCHTHGLITHPFRFFTAYPRSRNSTPSTVTTFHQSAFETVDYIFFTPPTKRRAGFHLLSRKALPSTHVLLDLGPQPHRFLSSDHLLLQASFQLVSKSPGAN